MALSVIDMQKTSLDGASRESMKGAKYHIDHAIGLFGRNQPTAGLIMAFLRSFFHARPGLHFLYQASGIPPGRFSNLRPKTGRESQRGIYIPHRGKSDGGGMRPPLRSNHQRAQARTVAGH